MNLARRCRPSLAVSTVLAALALGGCSYTPERSLAVAETAQTAHKPQAPGQAKAKIRHTAKSSSASKSTAHASRTEHDEATAGKRSIIADAAARFTHASNDEPRRKLFANTGERECLVRAMYFESQRASREGLLAVGTVVMNRVNSPSYPGTICGVVGQKRQFAAGVLSRPLSPRDRHHAEAVAEEILAGKRHTDIGDAMFFHVASRRYKYPNMRYLHVAGGNIFYRKVGRDAPQLAEGTALAYAVAPPPQAPDTAKETPVITVADASAENTAAAPTQQSNAVDALANAIPLPMPRMSAIPSHNETAATIATATAASDASVQPTSSSPERRTSGTGLSLPPLSATLASGAGIDAEPPTRLSYRALPSPTFGK